MRSEYTVDITGRGHTRATVTRESLRSASPILVDGVSYLTVREARALARAITSACDQHTQFRAGSREQEPTT